jgi:hypothetical protein
MPLFTRGAACTSLQLNTNLTRTVGHEQSRWARLGVLSAAERRTRAVDLEIAGARRRVTARAREIEGGAAMNKPEMPAGRTVIGGRHGSPSVTIALPFSHLSTVDEDVRDAVADLATFVARPAELTAGTDTEQIGLVRDAAEELASRVSSSRR